MGDHNTRQRALPPPTSSARTRCSRNGAARRRTCISHTGEQRRIRQTLDLLESRLLVLTANTSPWIRPASYKSRTRTYKRRRTTPLGGLSPAARPLSRPMVQSPCCTWGGVARRSGLVARRPRPLQIRGRGQATCDSLKTWTLCRYPKRSTRPIVAQTKERNDLCPSYEAPTSPTTRTRPRCNCVGGNAFREGSIRRRSSFSPVASNSRPLIQA